MNDLLGQRGTINNTYSPTPHSYYGRLVGKKFTVVGKSRTPNCVTIQFDGNKTNMLINVVFLDMEEKE